MVRRPEVWPHVKRVGREWQCPHCHRKFKIVDSSVQRIIKHLTGISKRSCSISICKEIDAKTRTGLQVLFGLEKLPPAEAEGAQDANGKCLLAAEAEEAQDVNGKCLLAAEAEEAQDANGKCLLTANNYNISPAEAEHPQEEIGAINYGIPLAGAEHEGQPATINYDNPQAGADLFPEVIGANQHEIAHGPPDWPAAFSNDIYETIVAGSSNGTQYDQHAPDEVILEMANLEFELQHIIEANRERINDLQKKWAKMVREHVALLLAIAAGNRLPLGKLQELKELMHQVRVLLNTDQ